MLTARRGRISRAAAVSVAAHVAVLAVVALQSPMLTIPVEPAGPPIPVIPVLLLPKTPPPAAGQKAQPQPIRLHRRPQPFVPPDVTPAPIAPPAPPAASPAPKSPVVVFHPAPQPEGPKGDVRTALRHSPVGCANPLAVGLNRAERELCDEKLGKGAKDAPFYEPGLAMSAAKKGLMDRAAANREADYKYTRTQPIQSAPGGDLQAGGEPASQAKTLGKNLGNDKPEYSIPIPR